MFETTNQLCKITPHHTSFSRHRHATAKVCVSLSTAFVKSHLAAVKTNRPKKTRDGVRCMDLQSQQKYGLSMDWFKWKI